MPSFLSSVSTLLRGSLLAQLIGFAALPVLSRLYAPSEFGALQALMSVLTVLLILSSLRLEVALMTAPDSELAELLRVAIWVNLLTATAVAAPTAAIVLTSTDWQMHHRIAVGLLPAVGLVAGYLQLLNYLGLRKGDFGTVSNAKVVQSAAYASGAAGLGIVKASSVSLLLADMVARVAATAFISHRLRVKFRDVARPPKWGVVSRQLRAHRSLVTTSLIAALVNSAGSSFTAVMLIWLFSAADAGQYAMVERFIGLPVGLIAGAGSQVFMSHLAHHLSQRRGADALREYRRIVLTYSACAILPMGALFVLAPSLMPLVLGPQWKDAGLYAQALVPLYLLAFAVGPVNMTLTVLGRQRLQLGWDAGRLAAMASMWWVVSASGISVLSALWCYSTVACAGYLVYLLLADMALRTHAASITRGRNDDHGG